MISVKCLVTISRKCSDEVFGNDFTPGSQHCACVLGERCQEGLGKSSDCSGVRICVVFTVDL